MKRGHISYFSDLYYYSGIIIILDLLNFKLRLSLILIVRDYLLSKYLYEKENSLKIKVWPNIYLLNFSLLCRKCFLYIHIYIYILG